MRHDLAILSADAFVRWIVRPLLYPFTMLSPPRSGCSLLSDPTSCRGDRLCFSLRSNLNVLPGSTHLPEVWVAFVPSYVYSCHHNHLVVSLSVLIILKPFAYHPGGLSPRIGGTSLFCSYFSSTRSLRSRRVFRSPAFLRWNIRPPFRSLTVMVTSRSFFISFPPPTSQCFESHHSLARPPRPHPQTES